MVAEGADISSSIRYRKSGAKSAPFGHVTAVRESGSTKAFAKYEGSRNGSKIGPSSSERRLTRF
jgi:hypothetical protein